MTTQEKKQALQEILLAADDGLTNVLMETVVEYNKTVQKEFILTDEYIAELERRSADLRSGKDKGSDPRETILLARKKLEEFRQQNKHAI